MSNFIFSDILNANLNEESVDPEKEEKRSSKKNDDQKKTKDQDDRQEKDISDLDKDDMDDDENRPEDKDVAVSITLNDNVEKGGKIKLVNFTRLSTLTTIESCLELFKIDPEKVDQNFKDVLQITFRSPLKDFSEEEYEVKLMDMMGEISVHRPGYNTSITKKSVNATGNTDLDQAVQNNVSGEEPENQGKTPEPPQNNENKINLDYLPDLDDVFRKVVYNEFFNRILQSQNE